MHRGTWVSRSMHMPHEWSKCKGCDLAVLITRDVVWHFSSLVSLKDCTKLSELSSLHFGQEKIARKVFKEVRVISEIHTSAMSQSGLWRFCPHAVLLAYQRLKYSRGFMSWVFVIQKTNRCFDSQVVDTKLKRLFSDFSNISVEFWLALCFCLLGWCSPGNFQTTTPKTSTKFKCSKRENIQLFPGKPTKKLRSKSLSLRALLSKPRDVRNQRPFPWFDLGIEVNQQLENVLP